MTGLFDKKKSTELFDDMLDDVDEGTSNKKSSKNKDFYGEEDNFSDLDKPVGGYYGAEKKKKGRKKRHGVVFDYEWWEVVIFIIEVLLVTYAILVFLGIVPLF